MLQRPCQFPMQTKSYSCKLVWWININNPAVTTMTCIIFYLCLKLLLYYTKGQLPYLGSMLCNHIYNLLLCNYYCSLFFACWILHTPLFGDAVLYYRPLLQRMVPELKHVVSSLQIVVTFIHTHSAYNKSSFLPNYIWPPKWDKKTQCKEYVHRPFV